jgi:integrase
MTTANAYGAEVAVLAGTATAGVGEWVTTAEDPAVAARREELTGRAREFARGSRAATTWRVYEARWARFTDWCAEHGECPLPADPLTICRFLTDLAPRWRPATPYDPSVAIVAGHVQVRPGARPTTVAGYLAAISVAHQGIATPTAPGSVATSASTGLAVDMGTASAGVAATSAATVMATNPARHEMVGQVLAGIRRHPTVAPARRRTALRPADLTALLEPLRPDESLTDARDAALLLLGWKAALRTDDLARLDLTDVVVSGEGLTVHLRRSKTDQTGAGDAIGITVSAPDDLLDAVRVWTRWRNRLASHGLHTGPAWRGIDRYDRRPRTTRLTTKSLAAIITTRAAAAGLDGDIGGHSLRRGFATSALAGGASERAVQRHGRWRSPASMAGYIDEGQRFDDTNPTHFLRAGT